MERIIILSNPGSSSKKYSVYNLDTEVAWFHFEKQNSDYVCSYKIVHTFEKVFLKEEEYQKSLSFVITLLQKNEVIKTQSDIEILSIRAVIPDQDFVKDTLITQEITQKLVELQIYDPLHITPILDELQSIEEHSLDIQVCLISDSTFHINSKRMLPIHFEKDMYSIGYHGLSCESVLSMLQEHKIEHSKLIVCHLGGGSSVTAIRNGTSVYNSMEYSPLGGMIMSSRTGSIDPFLILYLMKEKSFSYEEVLAYLYKDSGLKALSKISDDLRIVREEAFKGNQYAKNAIMQFVNSITSYILQATSYTEGIDTLVFTGTIGFRASYIREMVTEKLKWLGISINHDNNIESMNTCFEISQFDSKIKVYVVLIDEMKEMHKHTKNLLKSKI